jgi:hypothetical protein
MSLNSGSQMRLEFTQQTAVRLYFVGLLLAVSLRDVSNPIFDTIPTIELIGIEIRTSSQLYSLQMLALLSLSLAAIYPRSSLASLFAMFGFGTFTAASYSMVYAKGFNYLPHSANIHFFLIALIGLRNLATTEDQNKLMTRSMIFVIGWPYMAAFFTKLREVGLSWAWDETLPSYFQIFALLNERPSLSWIAAHPSLILAAGVCTLAFEFLALPGLFWQRTRRLFMATALCFHAAIFFLFGIQFLTSVLTAFVLVWSEDA